MKKFVTIIKKQLFSTAVISVAVLILTGFSPASAALNITKTHNGDFTQGQSGATYTITVSNVGAGATIGAVTVTDNWAPGLFATEISGTGWSCNLGTLSCMRSDVLAPGASYPAITLTVNVAEQWPLNILPVNVINTATVSGGGSPDNTATDVATVNRRQNSVAAVPTMTGWGMIIFTAFAGLRSFYYLMRKE